MNEEDDISGAESLRCFQERDDTRWQRDRERGRAPEIGGPC